MRPELALARIMAGCQIVGEYLYKSPSLFHKYKAEHIYEDALQEGFENGLYDEEELLVFLLTNGFWSEEDETKLKGMDKDIDEMKIKIYENYFKSEVREGVRKHLRAAEEQLNQLHYRRHQFAHTTAIGYANSVKSRYLIGHSLYREDGSKLFINDNFLDDTHGLIDDIIDKLQANRLEDGLFRKMVRIEPWRSVWAAKKATGNQVFPVPSSELTDEQRAMITWSSIYDSINEHNECPPDGVINDDDAIDGWMIVQRRKRENNTNSQQADDLIKNPKIKNAHEIYMIAKNKEDAQKIDNLNSPFAKMIKKHRAAALAKHGVVNELDMPDVRQRLNIEAAQAEAAGIQQRAKSGKMR